jgi:hypothetical protein
MASVSLPLPLPLPLPLTDDDLPGAIEALTDALPAMGGGITSKTVHRMLELGLVPDTRGLRLLIAVRTILQLADHEANGRLAEGSVARQFPHAALARAINKEGPAPDAT